MLEVDTVAFRVSTLRFLSRSESSHRFTKLRAECLHLPAYDNKLRCPN